MLRDDEALVRTIARQIAKEEVALALEAFKPKVEEVATFEVVKGKKVAKEVVET